ncbi:MAG: NifU family protein [Deltaproteobacteria bacterium]|nr:NifU family protein [Deltaproteobacteria bacterium]
MRKKVEEALDEVRPYLQADGGDVTLVEIDEEAMVVKVQLEGACGGCPSAAMTLKAGVENTVKKHAPEINAVEPV